MSVKSEKSILQTIIGVPAALIVWIVVYLATYYFLEFIDNILWVPDNLFRDILRALISPSLGGYAAIGTVHLLLPRANVVFVTITYCLPIVCFYLISPIFFFLSVDSSNFDGSIYNVYTIHGFLGIGIALATCLGSYFYIRKNEIVS